MLLSTMTSQGRGEKACNPEFVAQDVRSIDVALTFTFLRHHPLLPLVGLSFIPAYSPPLHPVPSHIPSPSIPSILEPNFRHHDGPTALHPRSI